MAELDAFGRAVKDLTFDGVTLNADGSSVLSLHDASYKPQLRLAGGETSKLRSELVVPTPPPPSPESFHGYSAARPMPAGVIPYAGAPFAAPLPSSPVLAGNSAALVASALQGGVENAATGGGGYTTIVYASPSDPLLEIRCTGPGSSLTGRKIPVPAHAQPAGPPPPEDAHLTVVLPNGDAYDFWQCVLDFSGGKVNAGGAGLTNLTSGNGVCTTGGANAAGFGMMAGVIRAQEMIAGVITHPLVCSLKVARIGHKPPAIHDDGSTTNANDCQEGQLFGMNYTAAQIAALNAPPWEKIVAEAIRHYGMYVCDKGGGGMGIKFESGKTYTGFGLPDPLVAWGEAHGAAKWEGKTVFHFNTGGVDWSRLVALA